jgi:hypothetical protein
MNDVDALIEQVRSSVRRQLEGFVGIVKGADTENAVADQINSVLNHHISDDIKSSAIKLVADPSDPTSLIAGNLYTLLLMMHIVVDYDEVKDKTEYELSDGTKIIYQEGESKALIRPAKSLKMIKGTFALQKGL